jgi:endonuclease/exonuclease/phosphatase family metal-dependent hydrolase
MQHLRVATLNIWNKSGPWPERLELIRAELQSLQPDLVGLQEVLRLELPQPSVWSAENDQASEIAAGLGYQIAYAPAGFFGGGVTLGNALLSRFPIAEQRTIVLPGKESGESRSLLVARVIAPAGVVPVFVTHLNWKLHHGYVRVEQVRAIAGHVSQLAAELPEALPAVLMGDFNAEPDSDEIRYLRGLATLAGGSVYFADAWIYGGDGTPGHTFDAKNRFAASAHEPPRRIDYIFVRGPDGSLRGKPLRTRLAFCSAKSGPGGDIWPSDHFGVVTDVAMAPELP